MVKKTKVADLHNLVLVARIESLTPLLMHNVRSANPLGPWAKGMKALTTKKKSRGADADAINLELSRLEWESGLYHLHTESPYTSDPSRAPHGAYLPAISLRSAIHEAAKVTREGQTVLRGLTMQGVGQGFPLIYDGPVGVEDLWSSGEHVDQRMVTVARARVARTRPIFREWGIEVTMLFDPEVLSEESLRRFLVRAGTMIGVGDGRTVLQTGRFAVHDIEVKSG